MFCHFTRNSARIFLGTLLVAFCLTAGLPAEAAVRSRVEGEALIAEKPLEPSSYEIYARFLSGNGAFKEASEVLERGRIKALPSANLLVALGEAYEAQGLVGRAEAATREALVLDDTHVMGHLQMGDLYFQLGWPKSGLDSYRQAVALAPGDPAPMVRLVAGHLEANQLPLAEDTCLKFISEHPEQPDLWLSLGQVFEKQEKRREAFTTYGQVLTLDPENSLAFARQGRLFCQFGQFTSAETACRRALELDPDNKLAHAYLGIAFSYLGNNDGARKHAQIAEAAGLNMMSVWNKIGN
jgi:tetratricopeptide (TPR) repeat protein|nr:tetratricopeptide repeat protein [Candidatus Krumholzibacteria bacterium]